MLAISGSFRGDVKGLLPGARCASALLISVSVISKPAGQPSITTPMALPCDSPHVVILNIFPNELLVNHINTHK